MPGLVTLQAAPYSPYNTSLAEIALRGIELGQKEMAQRDQLAQNAFENSMKSAQFGADQVQRMQENQFKAREQARLEQAMVWQNQIDHERLGLASAQFEESKRQFDVTLPLKQQEIGLQSRGLDLREEELSERKRQYDSSLPLQLAAANNDMIRSAAALANEKNQAKYYETMGKKGLADNLLKMQEEKAKANNKALDDWYDAAKNETDDLLSLTGNIMGEIKTMDFDNPLQNSMTLAGLRGAQFKQATVAEEEMKRAAKESMQTGKWNLVGGGLPPQPSNSLFPQMSPDEYKNKLSALTTARALILESTALPRLRAEYNLEPSDARAVEMAAAKDRISKLHNELRSQLSSFNAKESLGPVDGGRAFSTGASRAAGSASPQSEGESELEKWIREHPADEPPDDILRRANFQ